MSTTSSPRISLVATKAFKFLAGPYPNLRAIPSVEQTTWNNYVESSIQQLLASESHALNKLTETSSTAERTPTVLVWATASEWSKIGYRVDATAPMWTLPPRLSTRHIGFIPMPSTYFEYGHTIPFDTNELSKATKRLLALADMHNIKVIMNGKCISGHKIDTDYYVTHCGENNGMAFPGKVVIVQSGLHPRYEVKVLAHEIAHQLLKHTRFIKKPKHIEVQAETLAYVLMRTLGMPSLLSSKTYLKNYCHANEQTIRDALPVKVLDRFALSAYQLQNIPM